MKRRSKAIALFVIILFATTLCKEPKTEQITPKEAKPNSGIIPWTSWTDSTYKLLENVVANKKRQLKEYLEIAKTNARQIKDDPLMNEFFSMKRNYYYTSLSMEVPEDLIKEIEQLKQSIQKHYINNYITFYDILFVDEQGAIFYTIRKQNDYKKNIFKGSLQNTALSKKMLENPKESFVDFQFYEISGEPSAFFIEPVKNSEGTKGWFIMQFAINKINHLFSIQKELGASGEVFLVNKSHQMLTDSRFSPESTILKQQLSEENISNKFEEGSGRKSVIDYLGRRSFSAFETFEFFGSEWLIIAKISEAEVITDYYKNQKEYLRVSMQKALQIANSASCTFPAIDDKYIEVDIDEFRRARKNENLYTHGVSECTAFIVALPGKFSYMAHISPYDKIYGENKTDLTGQLLRRIHYLEIIQAEKHALKFIITATHFNTIDNIINILLEEGYFLNQIKFIQNTDARYANVLFVHNTGEAIVNWKMENANGGFVAQNSKDWPSIKDCLMSTISAN